MLEILRWILEGGTLVTLIIFLITRRDNKKEKEDTTQSAINEINKRMEKQERDSVRVQILLLIFNYHEEDKEELLNCAEYYFKKKEQGGLEGDWYLTDMFKRFLVEHDIEKPSWF